MITIKIPVPPQFRFLPTAISHGWCELPPFRFDDTQGTLERIQQLSDGAIVKLYVSAPRERLLQVAVEGSTPLKKSQEREIISVVERCLNVHQELANFYQTLRGAARYRWVSKVGAGRLLVSPTVWEDLAKTLLTTNTTWNVTVAMCRRLAMVGDEYSNGATCFPTPRKIVRLGVVGVTDKVRAGYRSEYLYELAKRIDAGELDVEAFRNPGLPTDELYRMLKSIKGFGDYAAGSMLKLLGRFDKLGIDTGCRDVFRAQIKGGPVKSDDEIREYYEPYGLWRGLVMWMDVMKVNLTKNLRELRSDGSRKTRHTGSVKGSKELVALEQ